MHFILFFNEFCDRHLLHYSVVKLRKNEGIPRSFATIIDVEKWLEIFRVPQVVRERELNLFVEHILASIGGIKIIIAIVDEIKLVNHTSPHKFNTENICNRCSSVEEQRSNTT